MGLLGAIFGGSIGFMFGGPLGAMIGGAIGAQSGGSFHAGQARGRMGGTIGGSGPFAGQGRTSAAFGTQGYRSVEEAQSAFLVALISLAAKVSKADGSITQAEIQTFDSFLRDNMRLPAEERKMAARVFNQARDSQVPAGDFARQIRSILGRQPDRLRDLITLLLQIAHADGHLHTAEDQLIRGISRDMGLSDRDYNECKALFGASSTDVGTAYDVLGLEPDVSDAEVKKAYRRIAREYHPDVLTSKGLPDEFMQFAKEKLQKVNQAYDQIKKDRGF